MLSARCATSPPSQVLLQTGSSLALEWLFCRLLLKLPHAVSTAAADSSYINEQLHLRSCRVRLGGWFKFTFVSVWRPFPERPWTWCDEVTRPLLVLHSQVGPQCRGSLIFLPQLFAGGLFLYCSCKDFSHIKWRLHVWCNCVRSRLLEPLVVGGLGLAGALHFPRRRPDVSCL